MQVDARLTFDRIRHDEDFDAHLVVSLTAPAMEEGDNKRQPLCIVPVIDVSPSMEWNQKFEYAKRSILKLIDHLAPGDYCGLIQFSRIAEVVAEPVKITPESKETLKRKVGDLEIGSATNIADALLKGLEVANKMDLSSSVLTRVILFTDGEANVGVATEPADILKLVEPNLGLASVSAFGYGEDAQQDLLADIAKDAKGNYAFIQNPDDALSAFGKELGGLLSTHATSLVIDVKPLKGHEVTSVVSDVDAQEKEDIGGEIQVKIPDLLAEETRHLVFGVKLAEQKNTHPRAVGVFDVEVCFDILNALSRKERQEVKAKAKVQFVKAGEEQEKADKDLDQIVGLAQVVEAQIEAEVQAKAGDFTGAVKHMKAARRRVMSRGLVGVGAIAAKVSTHLGSNEAYASGGSYLASMSRGGTRAMGVASYDIGAAADLSNLGVSMDNAAMRGTSASFEQTDSPGSSNWNGFPDVPTLDEPEATPDPLAKVRVSSKRSNRW